MVIGFTGLVPANAQRRIDLRQKTLVFSGTEFRTLPFGPVKKVSSGESVLVGGVQLVRKTHQLRRSAVIRSTEICSEINGTSVPVADEGMLYLVRSYVSYEFSSRVFAYEVEYEFFDVDTGEEIGATTAAHYVDALGDGTFGIVCVQDFKLETVPEWILNLARPR